MNKNLTKVVIGLVSVLILTSLPTFGSQGTTRTQPTIIQLQGVANSLYSRYNSTLGLVYESNTAGNHSYSKNYQLNESYWIYNDNGQAIWALQNYYPAISGAISSTIQYYTSSYHLPSPNYDEVFWGIASTTKVYTADNVIVTNGTKYVILDEIHNGSGIFNNWQDYGNLVVVHSLNNYIHDNYTGALKDFYIGESKWNGVGINDAAVNASHPIYSDYKLAALIFDAKVLNVWNTNMSAIENELWSHQINDSGIAVNYGNGANNSTNSETDALTLMAYNAFLIYKIQYSVLLEFGHQQLQFAKGHSRTFPLTISGQPQNVTLSYNATLPNGVSIKFSSTVIVDSTKGTKVNMTITASSKMIGPWPKIVRVVLIAIGQDGKSSRCSFVLTIKR